MPRGDRTGPNGAGRRNLHNRSFGSKDRCLHNNRNHKSRPEKRNQILRDNPSRLTSSGINQPLLSITSTLFGLVLAAVPVLIKIKTLLSNSNPKEIAPPKQEYTHTITIEPEIIQTDKIENRRE